MNIAPQLSASRVLAPNRTGQLANHSETRLSAGSRDAFTNFRYLQRTAGNQAVNSILRHGWTTPSGFLSSGVVRRMPIQRDDPPDPDDPFKDPTKRPDPITGPGGPGDTNDKGFSCGIKNGKFSCGADVGKGDPLDLPGDWSKFGPTKPDAGNLQGPGNCAPGAYNKLWQKCCPDGQKADDSGMNCVSAASPAPAPSQSPSQNAPDPLPPMPAPEPSQPGDYNVPDPNAPTQVA